MLRLVTQTACWFKLAQTDNRSKPTKLEGSNTVDCTYDRLESIHIQSNLSYELDPNP